MIKLSNSLVFSTILFLPSCSFAFFDFPENWFWSSDCMSCRYDSHNWFEIVFDFFKDLFMSNSSYYSHLLVNFSAKAGYEWFKYCTKQIQSIYSCKHDLSTSLRIGFRKFPRFGCLEVQVALRWILHSNSQTVLELDLFHQLNVSIKAVVDVFQEIFVLSVTFTFISR